MGTQLLDQENLPEIPSEYLEPYLKRFMMMQLEAIALGLTTPEKARIDLTGVGYFARVFGGLHSQMAVSREYNRFSNLTDEQMINVAKTVFKA